MKVKIILLLILFLLLIIKKKETFINKENLVKIGFIIPVTSNKRNYKKIKEIPFFKVLLNSLKNKLNENYEYNFYLGYDNDDIFYKNNINKLINTFNKLKLKNSNIYTFEIFNKKNKVGSIWSDLAQKASKKCDYLYQLGDDIEIITPDWEKNFIKKLNSNNNIGVVGPTDINNRKIITQSFVHKNHLKIFKNYFPNELINWYIDDWITNVYKEDYSYQFNNIFVKNSGGKERYKIHNDKKKYEHILNRDKNKLNEYLKN